MGDVLVGQIMALPCLVLPGWGIFVAMLARACWARILIAAVPHRD